jgi:hypothetical protein
MPRGKTHIVVKLEGSKTQRAQRSRYREAGRGVKYNVLRLDGLRGLNVYYIMVGTSPQPHFLEIQCINPGAATSLLGNTERGHRLMPPSSSDFGFRTT